MIKLSKKYHRKSHTALITIFTESIMHLVYPYPPPLHCQMLHKYSFQFQLGMTVTPRRNWKQWVCQIFGVNKVHFWLWVKMVNAGNSTYVEKCTLWALLELCVFFFLNLCHMWLQCNTCAAINRIVNFYLE